MYITLQLVNVKSVDYSNVQGLDHMHCIMCKPTTTCRVDVYVCVLFGQMLSEK